MNVHALFANVLSSNWIEALSTLNRSFVFKDAIDIVIASFFIYLILVFIKQTRSYFIFVTLAALLVVSYLAEVFGLGLTRQLFQPILTFFLVIFVIVFQREIRRFFRWFTLSRQSLGRSAATLSSEISAVIVHAVHDMAKVKMGALIVLSGDYPLDDIIEGGFPLDGKISSPLILSIFDHTTPGHDGAMIIENKRIKRFGVHLPLAEDFKGFATMGTRHRATVGISERTDCLAIAVSEERGTISVAEGGILKTLQNAGELDDIIKRFLKENTTEESGAPSIWKYMLFHNFYSKVVAVAIAAMLWFVLVDQSGTVNRDFKTSVEFVHVPAGLLVTEAKPDTINLSFSGESRDINALSPSLLRARVDLTSTSVGPHDLEITKDELQYPSYITLIKSSPATIHIVVAPVTSTSTFMSK